MAEHSVRQAGEDRAEIIAHIHAIFDAYIRRDREAIRRTHTPDWTGFQHPSARIERGLEDYMKNAELSLRTLRGTGFELLDTEVQIHGDVAIVYYVARYDFEKDGGERGSVPLRSVDIYRRERDGWIQCGSHIGVIPAAPSWTS
jgi:ketosteroid isomerase-like protein